MLRYVYGAGSALLLILAGFFIWRIQAQPEQSLPQAPVSSEADEEVEDGDAPSAQGRPRRPPSAPERSKEERRFNRADRNNDGRVSREELLQPRQKAFQRLDANRNGSLSFEEWAARSITKFGTADANRDGALTRQEYATTAPRPRPRPKGQNCAC
jgi:hypothetical protein